MEPNSAAKERLVKVSPVTFSVSSVSEKCFKTVIDLIISRDAFDSAENLHIEILLLTQELCNPVYNSDHGLGSSVSVAVASATAAAAAAVFNKDPTNVDSYPACAVSACPF